jgi:hypothetical protein
MQRSWCSDLPLVNSIEYNLMYNNSEAGLDYLALRYERRVYHEHVLKTTLCEENNHVPYTVVFHQRTGSRGKEETMCSENTTFSNLLPRCSFRWLHTNLWKRLTDLPFPRTNTWLCVHTSHEYLHPIKVGWLRIISNSSNNFKSNIDIVQHGSVVFKLRWLWLHVIEFSNRVELQIYKYKTIHKNLVNGFSRFLRKPIRLISKFEIQNLREEASSLVFHVGDVFPRSFSSIFRFCTWLSHWQPANGMNLVCGTPEIRNSKFEIPNSKSNLIA